MRPCRLSSVYICVQSDREKSKCGDQTCVSSWPVADQPSKAAVDDFAGYEECIGRWLEESPNPESLGLLVGALVNKLMKRRRESGGEMALETEKKEYYEKDR